MQEQNEPMSLNQRLIRSPVMACVAGCAILWVSFGIRQTFGVFLIPITTETGWHRSTYSIAAALLQLLWGFSQPFLVFLAERKVGFGKTIFVSSIIYAVGCFILYASGKSAGLFVFAMGAVIGISAGGNSFPNVLASVGRRFPQGSKHQSIAFGIVSSFGSFGQCCFLPIARAFLTSIGWRMTFIVFGVFMVALSPLAYYLQTLPPIPALPQKNDEEEIVIDEKKQDINQAEVSQQEEVQYRPLEDISAPDIKTALKEAFTSSTFIFITLGFSVCGFHIAFLSTHLPAYLQDNGINSSLAAWTISILGLGSMVGTISTGYLSTIFLPKYVLMGIYGLRAILIVIIVFIPISVTTVMVFSVFFGFLWLSTVPPTTKFVGDVFGHKYLGTLTSITFVGHQIGSFMGAYIGGVVYDKTHSYNRMWYGSIAMAAFGIAVNFLAAVEPMNKVRARRQVKIEN
ncbi:major facilitator superfamily domain-containing protein [Mucor mucedo]|uniref:major facilitator superfamily domain-containing protein n=1 Tax=Mucor mucedo TaxID=29922 RepID=UPI002220F7A4|nr:major facilitator superfamily domain-containing protein [Mucor mucedo]KAI7888338.1 major facilitator superfamily domain-containing protein [Mucor mucedo]